MLNSSFLKSIACEINHRHYCNKAATLCHAIGFPQNLHRYVIVMTCEYSVMFTIKEQSCNIWDLFLFNFSKSNHFEI